MLGILAKRIQDIGCYFESERKSSSANSQLYSILTELSTDLSFLATWTANVEYQSEDRVKRLASISRNLEILKEHGKGSSDSAKPYASMIEELSSIIMNYDKLIEQANAPTDPETLKHTIAKINNMTDAYDQKQSLKLI